MTPTIGRYPRVPLWPMFMLMGLPGLRAWWIDQKLGNKIDKAAGYRSIITFW